MLSYEGIFFDEESTKIIHSLETKKLDKINDEIHCTFKYHPNEEEIFNEIVGKSFDILLIGYGNDGINSGFRILLPDELMPYYINWPILPHVTASLSNGAKASNTKNLEFKPLVKPIKIRGKFGYWIKEEGKEYLSYEPFHKNKIKFY